MHKRRIVAVLAACAAAPASASSDTLAKLLREDGDAVVFENPAHDFPQRVIYRRVGDTGLHARI